VIEAIANAIGSTEGCNLLDVDAGLSTNRTVYTFVGSPEAVVEGALNGARVAAQLIDMTRHRGMLLISFFILGNILCMVSPLIETAYNFCDTAMLGCDAMRVMTYVIVVMLLLCSCHC